MFGTPFAKRIVCCPTNAFALLMFALVTAGAVSAQSPMARMAEQEALKRQQRVISAADDIQRADELMREGKVEEALNLFESVYNSLPNAPLTEEMRNVARAGVVQSGGERAQQLMEEGERAEADALLVRLLIASPGDKWVLGLQKKFADPDRYPPAVTAKHVANVREVERLLLLANSALEIGDYDRSIATYQDVLRIDKTSAAARRGMERAEQEKARYFKAAYDHQRARMLGKVSGSWEDAVPPTSADISSMFGAFAQSNFNKESGRERISKQLSTLTMPKVDFSGATITEVVELLRIRSRDMDPSGQGVDFVVNVDDTAANKPISLAMENVPMDEVLRYVTELAGVAYRVEEFAVQITSLGERNNAIISRTFRVPPDFIQNIPAAPTGAGNDPFAPAGGLASGGITLRRMGAKEFLESQGVPFPDGTSASFNASSSSLIVRNSVANMEMVEMLVEMATKAAPKMAVIHVRMIEVNQTNLDELGFDWLLGGVGWSGDSLLVGGGTSGNGTSFNAANYPFGNSAAIPGPSLGGTQVFPSQSVASAVGGRVPLGVPTVNGGGGGQVTAGLRSGGYATGAQALDSLLQTGSASAAPNVAPGVLSLAGVFTNPQFQAVMRGLSQKKGVDINASPSVTTKSGVKAVAEITREVIYPTEFDPPQLPQSNRALSTQMIATPTTPTAFETRKTGVIVEVEPVISEDGRSVEVTIAPELTDFEGFVNYGSPINFPSGTSIAQVQTALGTGFVNQVQPEQVITPNLILQPIFKVQKVVTSVKVWDGQTIVLGGAKIQRKTIVDDSVPILGNLPVLGRLFRSEVKQTETKNIIIFVTVEVVDPSGQRINKETASVAP